MRDNSAGSGPIPKIGRMMFGSGVMLRQRAGPHAKANQRQILVSGCNDCLRMHVRAHFTCEFENACLCL
jgi:hypothetical protein